MHNIMLGKIIIIFGVLFKKNEEINVVIIIKESSIKNIYNNISKNLVFLLSFIYEKISVKNPPRSVPRTNDIRASGPTLKKAKEKSVPKQSDLDKRYI